MPTKLWLRFEKRERLPKKKTDVYDVYNKEFGDWLGTIRWEFGWRQYAFSAYKSIYSRGCMQQIIDFINELMAERKN